MVIYKLYFEHCIQIKTFVNYKHLYISKGGTSTCLVIIETFKDKDPVHVPGVLCTNHGPFTWGADAAEAVHKAVVLEEVAKMAYRCEHLNPEVNQHHNICRINISSENMEQMLTMVKASNKNGSIFKKRAGNNMNNMPKIYRSIGKNCMRSACSFFLCLKTRQISKKQVKILLNIMIVCAEQYKSYGQ